MGNHAENRVRCPWALIDPLMTAYHDDEWGDPVQSDDAFFERMTLEVFQAGLNWRMILHKRAAFNTAFDNFSIARVGRYGAKERERLLKDHSIIRNRLKIDATIENARIFLHIKGTHGSFRNYLESLRDDEDELYREFKNRFRFMGPKIAESFLMSVGKIPAPHAPDCWKARK